MHDERVQQGDLVIVGAMVGTFALWVVLHVSLVWSLMRGSTQDRGGRRHFVLHKLPTALLALVLVPLAPVLGFMQRARVRSVLWIVAALGYAALRLRFG